VAGNPDDIDSKGLLKFWPIIISIGAILLAVGVFQSVVTQNSKDIEDIQTDFRLARQTLLSIEQRISTVESVDTLQNERLSYIAEDIKQVRLGLQSLEVRVNEAQTGQVRMLDRLNRIDRDNTVR
jgi:hypothetical protein